MTKEQVLQAIRVCARKNPDEDCRSCPYFGKAYDDCIQVLLNDAARIIKNSEEKKKLISIGQQKLEIAPDLYFMLNHFGEEIGSLRQMDDDVECTTIFCALIGFLKDIKFYITEQADGMAFKQALTIHFGANPTENVVAVVDEIEGSVVCFVVNGMFD